MNRSNRRRTRNQVYLCTYQWHLTNGKLRNFHCSYFHFSQFPLSLSKHSYFFFSSLSSALLSTYCALLQKRAHILNYILNTRVEGPFLFCLYKCIQLSSRQYSVFFPFYSLLFFSLQAKTYACHFIH